MATPPIIAVGFLLQRSPRGLAMTPLRRANARTRGVSASERASAAAAGRRWLLLKGITYFGAGQSAFGRSLEPMNLLNVRPEIKPPPDTSLTRTRRSVARCNTR